MRTVRYLSALLFLTIAAIACSHFQENISPSRENEDVLFQSSTINALLEGVYDGDITYHELGQHGNMGIGTFNCLDGEMIGLDGSFYQIRADGMAYPVDGSMKTPFAVVTFFEPDRSVLLDRTVNYEQLGEYLDSLLPTEGICYAIKIEGTFRYIKTRSVPKQSKPYPRLVEVVKHQPTFEFHNVQGTMVGFWCPGYVDGINVPGYHIHFITGDRKSGGHLLECQMENVKIGIDYTSNFYMALPKEGEFHKADLTKNRQEELEKVEK
jgi:acetolactate decarboxylase